MGTKKENAFVDFLGVGLIVWALWQRRKTKMVETAGFYGDPNDVAWYPDVSSYERQVGPVDQYGMTPNFPMGAVMEHPGKTCRAAHPRLSHTQWTQIKVRGYYEGGDTGEWGAYGDACARYKRRIKRNRKRLKRLKGREGRIGQGVRDRRMARMRKRIEKYRKKGMAAECTWATKKKRKKEMEAAREEESELEAKMSSEYQQAQQQIASTSQAIAAQSAKAPVNPLVVVLVLGGIAAFVLVSRKRSSA